MAERTIPGARGSGRASLAALAAGLLLAGGLATAQQIPPATQQAEHVVTIEGMQFTPATLTLKPGEKVTWINKDLVPHTASAVSKAFDSGVIAAGASWTYTVREAGSSAYVCLFHPTMQGTLIAQ
ncbi:MULTISPECIES: cupredoxin family copper-binding protein [Achromobacter]|uniref:cupredoxin domain-containing protein n=1 Tax=Achromobacter TaxID=222 RepID=UPI000A955693|nr:MULTISPECIES: cupredoxin family copper-binding protein [Achromobacter]MDH1301850.1 cupredoxin family copper-binding protein [Achromobacter sp. GD03932]WLW61348.1 cupredoxin family copper-binding protein [Achromobacter aegrifaciens]